jgi:hypothetical protein
MDTVSAGIHAWMIVSDRSPMTTVGFPETLTVGMRWCSEETRPPQLSRSACGTVRNQNTLVIQQADRFVVTRQKSDFVFAVAKKRKKTVRKHARSDGEQAETL